MTLRFSKAAEVDVDSVLSWYSEGMTLRTSFCSHLNSASIPFRKTHAPLQWPTGTSAAR